MNALGSLGASYALTPDLILTPEGVRRGAVLVVQDGRIAQIVDAGDYLSGVDQPAPVALAGHAIVAGFIDAHTHLGQTFGKAFVFGEPSQIWQRIWGPIEASLTPDLVQVSATWMCLEALRGGFTTIVNFAMGDEERTAAVHVAAETTGVRLVSCAGASDLADYPNPTNVKPRLVTIDQALRRAERHVDMCKGLKRVTASICCSGIQGATDALIVELAGFCARHGLVFQFHSNEHFPEVHGCILRYGLRPIELLASRGVLGRHVLLHHCTLVNEREIELLAESGTGVSYNPVASAWKGDGVAPAMSFVARGVRFGLGTDSTRSNALRLLDAAETCQRLTHGLPKLDFSCGAGWRWVDAATRGGADVAGLSDITGALAPGHAADFLVLDMQRPETLPSWDFEWELVRLYDREQIAAVFVDGRLCVQRGRAVGFDEDALIKGRLADAIAAVNASGALRLHGPSADRRARQSPRST
jgi:cytosine/adenosine deaminase-related metal-dependent hydrolase